VKNFSIKKTTPPQTEKEVVQAQTPLMKEFFEKRIVVLDKFEKRSRLYAEKIALSHQSPFPDVALSDSNQRKTLQEAKYPKHDDENLITNNISCEIGEKVADEVSKLNSVEFVNKEKIQNSKNKLNKHPNISYSLLKDNKYVSYDSSTLGRISFFL
jgi:hypothetical protein